MGGVQQEAHAERVRIRVPAKINLFLAVRGRRPDGYHELASVLQTVGLHDEVTVSVAGVHLAQHPAVRRFMDFDVEVTGAAAGVPRGEANLAVRAARTLLDAVTGGNGANGSGERASRGHDVPRTSVRIDKRIPVAAGLGGGSADAAATLIACNELWACGLEPGELREVAGEVGADVPFCVTGGTALATGTGTATAQVLCRGSFHWVIAVADQPLSTAEVYEAWDEHCRPTRAEPDLVLQALRTGDAEALGATLRNDLEQAAFRLRPGLERDRQRLLDAGALGAVVSGSGPTLVALAHDHGAATRIADAVGGHFVRVAVATSPANGPETLRR